MILTYKDAFERICQTFEDAWRVGTPVITFYVPEIRFASNERPTPPDASRFWCRHSVQPVDESQASLANAVGGGKKRYTAYGLVFVQIFCPKTIENALLIGQDLAQVAKNAYRGKQVDSIWFRNVRIVDANPEQSYYRLNVVAEYEYDELG